MEMPINASVDHRLSRGEATKSALMRAAEILIAENGIENVTIKEILDEAGQNNKTALQYHFGDMKGLVRSLKMIRGIEIRERRELLIERLLAQDLQPSLRDVCKLMASPAFELARERQDFRNFIKAFGHEIALSEGLAGGAAMDVGGPGIQKFIVLLRSRLQHLDNYTFVFRLDAALRFMAASFVHHSGQRDAFRGNKGELFFSNLLDALEGLLQTPESKETAEYRQHLIELGSGLPDLWSAR